MGHDPHGRRHASPAWLSLIQGNAEVARGRKLVVQMVETYQKGGVPAFVESLDAVKVGRDAGMAIAPIMIYGDDVTHVVTEEGVAYLYKTGDLGERLVCTDGHRRSYSGWAPPRCQAHRKAAARRSGCFPGGSRGPSVRGQAFAAGCPEHRGSRRLVRRVVQPARAFQELVTFAIEFQIFNHRLHGFHRFEV